jgi:Ca-activated chloride channel family protein
MRFEQPAYLLLLLLTPALVWLYLRVIAWKRQVLTRLGDERLVRPLISTYAPGQFRLSFTLLLASFLLGVLGLANLQLPEKSAITRRNGIDILLSLDVSRSMLTEDVKPSRLQRARLFINELVKKRPDDRFGLVLFAGHAYLQMPVTADLPALNMYVQSASPESVPTQGTALAEALKAAGEAFDPEQRTYKAVVLITDGEDHEQGALPVAKELLEEGTRVFTIGVGSSGGQVLMNPKTGSPNLDKQGRPVVSRLNESLLRELAENGGGHYQLLTDVRSAARSLSSELNRLETRPIADKSQQRYRSFFPWFLGLAGILLVAERFIAQKKKMP